jgi:hypothetical protein
LVDPGKAHALCTLAAQQMVTILAYRILGASHRSMMKGIFGDDCRSEAGGGVGIPFKEPPASEREGITILSWVEGAATRWTTTTTGKRTSNV